MTADLIALVLIMFHHCQVVMAYTTILFPGTLKHKIIASWHQGALRETSLTVTARRTTDPMYATNLGIVTRINGIVLTMMNVQVFLPPTVWFRHVTDIPQILLALPKFLLVEVKGT
jgi:hypothetical protein